MGSFVLVRMRNSSCPEIFNSSPALQVKKTTPPSFPEDAVFLQFRQNKSAIKQVRFYFNDGFWVVSPRLRSRSGLVMALAV
jgi:hypothetical protein